LNKCDELISIGSLGRGNAMTAEQIYVQNCSFTRTTNGARIKTFPVSFHFFYFLIHLCFRIFT